ncbi:hypothetical protein HPB49_009706 [Dermacentor silvarum]|uniref:Uncharacterized protein n=1 Tax=Dermacentor silvarum TaxID=543639 RepID=A0ACB8DYU7_DERSI|nr:hypothetical protein HPB49_009706 [Dermacentor silvarum]
MSPSKFEHERVLMLGRLFGLFLGSQISLELSIIRDVIEIMRSRLPSQALRPESASVEKLLSFLTCLTEWELHVGGRGGFLSASTAVGLRVAVASVLSLLTYMTKNVSYEYLMTSKLTQDPVQNLFAIARQSSSRNTHPIPQQFLITAVCLA